MLAWAKKYIQKRVWININDKYTLDIEETTDGLVWFLLFNGISTLFRLFNAKAILLEEQ